jgi:hypothetical protein
VGKALGLAAGARSVGTGSSVRPLGTGLGVAVGACLVGTGTGVRAPDTPLGTGVGVGSMLGAPLGQGDAEAAGCRVVLGTGLTDGDDDLLREVSATA